MKPEIVQHAIDYSYDILKDYPNALVEWTISFKEDVYNVVCYFDKVLVINLNENMFSIVQDDGVITYYDMDDIFSITIRYE